eukprot:4337471-Pleurochrysis_carterae.AAC.1
MHRERRLVIKPARELEQCQVKVGANRAAARRAAQPEHVGEAVPHDRRAAADDKSARERHLLKHVVASAQQQQLRVEAEAAAQQLHRPAAAAATAAATAVATASATAAGVHQRANCHDGRHQPRDRVVGGSVHWVARRCTHTVAGHVAAGSRRVAAHCKGAQRLWRLHARALLPQQRWTIRRARKADGAGRRQRRRHRKLFPRKLRRGKLRPRMQAWRQRPMECAWRLRGSVACAHLMRAQLVAAAALDERALEWGLSANES